MEGLRKELTSVLGFLITVGGRRGKRRTQQEDDTNNRTRAQRCFEEKSVCSTGFLRFSFSLILSLAVHLSMHSGPIATRTGALFCFVLRHPAARLHSYM